MKFFRKKRRENKAKVIVYDVRLASPHRRVVSLREKIWTFTFVVKIGRFGKFLFRHRLAFGTASLILFISAGLINNYLTTRAGSAEYYPSSALGSWKNSERAQGKPDLQKEDGPDKFTDDNSATLTAKNDKMLLLGKFQGETPENKNLKKIYLNFSWNIGKSDTVENVQTDDASSENTQAENNNLLEVLYTLDDENWTSLQEIDETNWKNAKLELPLTSWDDLSKVQIAIRSLPNFEKSNATASIDGATLSVLYQGSSQKEEYDKEELDKLPKKEIQPSEVFDSPQKDFQSNEAVEFKITIPDSTELDKDSTNIVPQADPNPEPVVEQPDIQDQEQTPADNQDTPKEPTDPTETDNAQTEELINPTNTETDNTTSAPQELSQMLKASSLLIDKLKSILEPKTAKAESVSVASLTVTDPQGQLTDIVPQLNESLTGTKIIIPTPGRDFKPGKYTLTVGFVSNGTLYTTTQDFTWGVLAINTNKSIYAPNETGNLAMAVLDEGGNMVCNAKVTLRIKNDKLKIEDELSTDNGKITVNPECQVKGFTLKPDYEAHYDFQGAGTYELNLTATTKNGTHSITDSIQVKKDVPFDVERITATRIFPPENYPVTFNITANPAFAEASAGKQDFKGEIREKVPASFDIVKGDGDYQKYDKEEIIGQEKILTWNVDIKKGDQLKLGYEFKAPDVSPEFYLLGPLGFYDGDNIVFEEARQWQIAADAWGVPKLGTLVEDPVSGGDFTLVEPGGVAQGDLMVAVIGYRGNAAITGLDGWSVVATEQNSGDADASNGIASGKMYYITRGASAPDLVCHRTAGDVVQARIISYSGYGNAYDTGSANTLASVNVTVTTGTITTAEANELLVAMVSTGDNDLASAFDAATYPDVASGTTDITSAPTANTWIERSDTITTTGADHGLAIADAIKSTAAATGTIQATSADASRNVMIVGAFKMNLPPTVNLDSTNSPVDASTGVSVTPDLNFVGTDANADTIEYNVQVDTAVGFDGAVIVQNGDSAIGYAVSGGVGTSSETNQAQSQSITPSYDFVADYVAFYLRKVGSPTDSLSVSIHTTSQTGTLVATSESVSGGDILGSDNYVNFSFSPGVSLSSGTTYYLVLERSGARDTSNYYYPLVAYANAYAGGIYGKRDNNAWSSPSNYDFKFKVGVDSLLSKFSATPDATFTNVTDGGGHPFDSGDQVKYVVQAGALTNNQLYYWRVAGKDPGGSYGAWSDIHSFTTADVAFVISGTSNKTSGTVAVAVNGALQTDKTGTIAGDGTWSISGVTRPSADAIVTVWVDGTVADADESTAIAEYSGSGALPGMVLNTNVLSIGGIGAQTPSLSDIITYNYDCTDNENIMFNAGNAVANTLQVEGTSCAGSVNNSYTAEKIDILTTDTLTVSGTETLSTYDLTITGALTSGGASAYSVGGNWANAGTFTPSTSTVTFTATDAGHTITDGGSNFNNVVFNNANGGWSFADSTILNGDLTMTAGTLSGTSDITVGGGDVTGDGDINLTGGTFTINNTEAGTVGDTLNESFTGATFPPITCDSGWTTGGNANWARDAGTFDTTPASAVAASITGSQSSWLDCNVTLSEPLTLTFKWSVSSESGYDYLNYCEDMDATCARTVKTLGISGTVAFTTVNRSLSAGTHSLRWLYAKDSTGNTGSDVGWLDTVLIAGGGITGEPAFGGATDWDFNSLAFNGASGTTASSGTGEITVADTMSIGSGHTLKAGSRLWRLTDSTGSPVTPLVASGTFDPQSSNVFYNNSGVTANVATVHYHYLNFNPSSASTFNLTGDLSGANGIDSSMSIGDNATLTTTGSSYDMDIGGSFYIANSGVFTTNSSTITFDGDGWDEFTDFSSSGPQNMGSVVINGSAGKVLATSTNMKVHDINIAVGNTLDITDYNLTITGTGTPFTRSGPETFATAAEYSSDSTAQTVAIGDLNNDGWDDMAVANSSNYDTISVLLNNGNGTFAYHADYSTGSYAYSVAIGDLNNDGWKDLAVVSWDDDTISIFMNNKDGTFADRVNYSAGDQPRSVAIGDLDNDGWEDLAVANTAADSVSVLRNNHNGTFSNKVDYVTDDAPYYVAIGDLNNDGWNDLAVPSSTSGYVSTFKNDQDGTFGSKVNSAINTDSRSLAIGDLNNDGWNDLAVGNGSPDTTSILINSQNASVITFAGKVDYADGSNPFSVAIGDLNNDGFADLVSSCYGSQRIDVRFNLGDGTFSSVVTYNHNSQYYNGVAIGDFDKDGWNDIAVGNGNSIAVFIGQGGDFITTGSTVTYTGSGTATNITTAGYNNLTLAPTSITNYSLMGDLAKSRGLTGNLTIGSNTTLNTTANMDYDIDVGGNWTNNGTFTANQGTVILNGTSEQNLSGTMTGTSAFYNLTITNNSGASATDNERTGFTPSVDFDAAAKATNNYIIRTANVRVEYESGATYEFANINWDGFADSTKICFRNSVDTVGSTWLLKVTGTQTNVSYVDVSRSDASVSGGSSIQAYDGTNRDSKNNTNWIFFSIRVRQEINLLNGSFSSLAASTATVGISSLNPGYSGSLQSYFEIVAKNTDSVTRTVYLRNWVGDAVIGQVDIPAGVADYTRFRSTTSFTFPVSLTSVYTNIPQTTSDGQIVIIASRVIVLQDNGSDFATGEETQVEIGNYETAKTNTSSAALDYPKYWLYTAGNWDGTKNFYAEVAYKTPSASGNVTIKLQKDDAGDLATWSDVTTIVNAQHYTTVTLSSRISFNPVDGCNYRIAAYISSDDYTIYNAKIIVDQTGAAIKKIEPQYLIQNTYENTAGLQNFDNNWDSSDWYGTYNKYYHEIDSSSDTGDGAKLKIDPNHAVEIADITSDASSGDFTINLYGGTGSTEMLGQSFTVPNSQDVTLNAVSLYLYSTGSPTDNVYIEIASGSFSGTTVATSDMVAASSVSSYTNFPFTSYPTLSANTKYYIRLIRTGARDTSNYVEWWYDNYDNSLPTGGSSYRSSGSWNTENNTDDRKFRIYAEPLDIIGSTATGAYRARSGAMTMPDYFNDTDTYILNTPVYASRIIVKATLGFAVAGTSDLPSGTVAVAMNNTPLTGETGTISGGEWAVTSLSYPGSDTFITAWVDGASSESNESTGIAKYSGSGNMTDMVLDANVLSIGGVGNQSITVSDLANVSNNYDHGDDDNIMHTASGTTLTVDGGSSYSTEKIDILSSDTLTVGGTETLNTYSIDIHGTLASGGSSAYNISGNCTIASSGTFTPSTSTMTFNGASGTSNFTDSSSGQDMGNVVINGSSGKSVAAQTAMKTTTLNIASNNTLDITSQTLTLLGTGTPFTKSGTFTTTGSTVIYVGSGTTTYITTTAYNNLTFTPTLATTYNLTGHLTSGNSAALTGNLAVSSYASLDVSASNYNIDLAGNWTNSGAFTPGSGTVTFTGSGTQDVNAGYTAANKAFNNLTHSGAGILRLITTDIDVNGTFLQSGGTFNCNSNSQNFAGAFTLDSGTTWTKGGTLTFDGASGTTNFLDSNGTAQDLGVVAVNGSSGKTIATQTAMKVTTLNIYANNTLDITNRTLTIAGTGTPFTKSGTFTTTGSTVIYVGSGTTTYITTTAYNNLTFTPTSTTTYGLTGSLTGSNGLTGNMTINADATLNSQDVGVVDSYNSYNSLYYLSSDEYLAVGQSFTGDGGTLKSVKFYIDKYGSPTGYAVAKVYDHSGTFGTSSVPTGAALATSDNFDVLDLTDSLQLINFTFSEANKITLDNGTNYVVTLEYSGGNSSNDIEVAVKSFGGTHLGNESRYVSSWEASSIGDMYFIVYKDGASLDIDVAGDWTNYGTLNAASGTVTLTGASSQTLIGNTTFNNLTVNAPASAGRTIYFTDGSTQTVSGTWTATGSAGHIITLTRSSSSSTWTINPVAAAISYATVSYSNSGLAICATYSTNGGNNNGNWSFSAGDTCGGSLGLSCAGSAVMTDYMLGSQTYNESTLSSTCSVTTPGSTIWSLTIQSTNLASTNNTITNSNVLLHTDGDPASSSTYTKTDQTTGISESNGSLPLNSIQTIIQDTTGTSSGTYINSPTIKLDQLDKLYYNESTSGTITITLS